MSDAPPLDVRRPFTRSDAVAAGLDPRLLRGSRFRRIFKVVHIARRSRRPRCTGCRRRSSSIPPRRSRVTCAARVYGVPLPDLADEHVSVSSENDRRRRAGIRCHVASPGTRVVRADGIRVSAPVAMFVELASMLPLVDLVVVGENLVRRKAFSPEELVEACSSWPGPCGPGAPGHQDPVRRGVAVHFPGQHPLRRTS